MKDATLNRPLFGRGGLNAISRPGENRDHDDCRDGQHSDPDSNHKCEQDSSEVTVQGV